MKRKTLIHGVMLFAMGTFFISGLAAAMGTGETTVTEFNEPILSQELNFQATLTAEGTVEMSWNEYMPANFNFYKVIRSQTNSNPVYPDDGYIFVGSAGQLSYTDTSVPSGVSYYRVCSIAKPDRYCSPVVIIENGEASLTQETVYTTQVKDTSTFDVSKTFVDTTSHWGGEFAEDLKLKCGVYGYRNEQGEYLYEFRPDEPVTRAELVKMLIQCRYGEVSGEMESFSDVDPTSWYALSVYKAMKLGWVQGYDDGTFKPDNEVNRAEALKMMLLSVYADTEIMSMGENFADVSPSDWFEKYVSFAVKKAYIEGYVDGTFGPGKAMTRAEVAKIVSLVSGY